MRGRVLISAGCFSQDLVSWLLPGFSSCGGTQPLDSPGELLQLPMHTLHTLDTLGVCLGIHALEGSPVDSSAQPKLTTTELGEAQVEV